MPEFDLSKLNINNQELAPIIDPDFGIGEPVPKRLSLNLSERFLIPPFSVLNARQGYWQERKKQWIDLGIQSELGRGDTPSTSARVGPDDPATYRTIGGKKVDNGLLGFSEQARSHYRQPNATPGGSPLPAANLGADGRTVRGDGRGRPLGAIAPNQGGADGIPIRSGRVVTTGAQPLYGAYRDGADDDTSRRNAAAQPQSGTSIFDPVLCELVYRWFSGEGGKILDPFAGGSVRGIVATKLDRDYVGIDLRPEQADANEEQAEVLVPFRRPTWVVGDAMNVTELCPGEYDLLFSCPPYGSLELYSDDPRDLSNMSHEAFLQSYRMIIQRCCSLLKHNRFACFVVGDFRDESGIYRNFVSDTITAFTSAGLSLYNEMVLITAVGSLPIRVGRQFERYRKVGKTHQNVLVFVKGDPEKASRDCGEVQTSDEFFSDDTVVQDDDIFAD